MKKTGLITLICLLSQIDLQAQSFNEVTKGVASDRDLLDSYGSAVDIHNNYAIVGAFSESEDEVGLNTMKNAGSAYIIEKDSNGLWLETQKVVASDRDSLYYFGVSVAITDSFAFVGAYGENKDSIGNSTLIYAGAVYVFKKQGAVWVQTQKLLASDRSIYDSFGKALDATNNTLAIAAPEKNISDSLNNIVSGAGAIYIYERDTNGLWVETQQLVASDYDSWDQLGNQSVAVHGNTVVAGAYNEDNDENGNSYLSRAGSAYIFEKGTNGLWTEKKKIVASDRDENDRYGLAVDVHDNWIAVGAYYEDEDELGLNNVYNAGSAYLYKKDTLGNWQEVQKIVPSSRSSSDNFGISVAISNKYCVVGAPNHRYDFYQTNAINQAGALFVFKKDSGNIWVETEKIVASDRADKNFFGRNISLYNNSILSGSNNDFNELGMDSLNNAGAVYFYEKCITLPFAQNLTICNGELVIVGNNTYSIPGNYQDTLTSIIGCDSIVYTTVQTTTIDTAITINGDTLMAVQSNASYQWLNCDNGFAAINGAIDSIFTPIGNGNYAVQISSNGCADTSICINMIISSVNSITHATSTEVYPNPTNGLLSILTKEGNITSAIIRNNLGQVLMHNKIKDSNQINIDISSYNSGVYFLQLEIDNEQVLIKKILKE